MTKKKEIEKQYINTETPEEIKNWERI